MKSLCFLFTASALLLAACTSVLPAPTATAPPTPIPPPTETQIPFETVNFMTEDGVRLAGTLRGEGEFAVILAHQGTPHADQTTWADFAHLLAEHGIASLAFDFRGIGRSQGTFLTADLGKDVLAATKYLQARGYQRIACGGASMGGTACMWAAQQAQYEGLIVFASGISAGSAKYGLHLTEEQVIAITPPKLFISAEDDSGTILSLKRMAEIAVEPKRLVLLPGYKHGTDVFGTESGPAATETLLAFLEALRDGNDPFGGTQEGSMPHTRVIDSTNAASLELLQTLAIPGFERASVSQCSVAFSPDQLLLSGVCHKSLIPVWDATTGEIAQTLEVQPSHEVAAAFSADGELLAVGGQNQVIRIWDAVSGELIDTLGELPAPCWDLDFSPDRTRLASVSFDIRGQEPRAGVWVWDIAHGDTIWEYAPADAPIRALSVAWSPDGTALAVGTFDSVLIFDAETGEVLHTLPVGNHVGDVGFSPDGERLAAGSDDDLIRIWDTYDYQLLSEIKGHTGYVNGVAFSPDGLLLASGSHDRTVRVWDAETGELRKVLEGHAQPVMRVDVNPLGDLIASISWDGTVKLWGVKE